LAKKLIGKVAKYDEIEINNGFEEMADYSNYAETGQMPLIRITRQSKLDSKKIDLSDLFVYEGVYKIQEAVDKIIEMQGE